MPNQEFKKEIPPPSLEEKGNKKEAQDKQPFLLQSELEKLGVKVDLFALGKKGPEKPEDFALDPKSVAERWKRLFSEAIKKHNISDEKLEEWSKSFSQKAKEIVEWLKKQSNPGQYEVMHSVNPLGGNEHIRVEKPGWARRVFAVTMRFERDACGIEWDNEFRVEL